MANKTALVVGVTGIVGYNLADELLKQGWVVYGTSRKRPDYLQDDVKHVAIDLTDKESCKSALGKLTDVTHVFWAAWIKMDTEEATCDKNREITENLIDNLPSGFEHFVLVTGTKHYIGPFDNQDKDRPLLTPFKTSLPRRNVRNFYYDQEDVMFDRAVKKGFTWSVARPSMIIGFAPRNEMNLGQSFAVYATMCKHLNLPFKYIGGKASYDTFNDCSDTEFIAKHLIWQATTPACANQAFNVVNGDVYKNRVLWKAVAEYFDLEVEGPSSDHCLELTDIIKDPSAIWDEIVQKHGLKKFKYEELMTWWFTKIILDYDVTYLSDMNTSRELGFKEYQNTEKSFFKLFDYLRANKYIP